MQLDFLVRPIKKNMPVQQEESLHEFKIEKDIREKFEDGVTLKFDMPVRPAREKMQYETHYNFKITMEKVIWG